MTTIRRIILGFANAEECRSALQEALGMAREMEAELVGMLARDESLEAASGIPCVSVRSRTYSRWEEIDEGIMKRAFAAEAVRVESLIATGARAQNVRWSFRTVSADRMTEEWGETDILLLPRSLNHVNEAVPVEQHEARIITRHILTLERMGYRAILRPGKSGSEEG
ncbi:hypothetical protein [Emcibacter sp.]|uniref:hypothetical protein n=1 Tax=Emcibacter sp. TaxID=1979954 RepID=UPI002AA93C09|nr:hypothetical protein [Emcibacter sp.]